MTEENNSNNGKFKAMGLALSIVLHLALGIAIVFISGDVPKPDEKQIVSINLQPEQPVAVPFVPEPDPPKPEPPKPEPPKPEPPKPEPPKPEPPKPEPPKPEPPKPEPPKPEPPKPKSEQPKPKTEQPKPKTEQPKPKTQQPKTKSIEERLRDSRTVKDNSKPKTNRNRKDIEKILGNATSTPSDNKPSRQLPSGGTVAEVTNYAEQVVKPYILQNWIQPVAGELDVLSVRPVTIGFTVYSGGSVQNVRIVKPSNSKVLNDSVRNFLAQMTRLPALSSVGIKASNPYFTISVISSLVILLLSYLNNMFKNFI
ncbi:MAG: TonB C-terminal domain-containing protein, partial [Victivallales bacterium]|nr:TonB C-terminal domain-containing protein [Victivallales bacterium]